MNLPHPHARRCTSYHGVGERGHATVSAAEGDAADVAPAASSTLFGAVRSLAESVALSLCWGSTAGSCPGTTRGTVYSATDEW